MENKVNSTLAYTSTTLLESYKQRRKFFLPLLKEEKDKEKLKKIHLALLSIDLSVQIFNDANKIFPLINKEILEHSEEDIELIKNKTTSIEKLKKGLEELNSEDNIIFKQKLYYSIELSNTSSKKIPSLIASNILKENAFLFTHILHSLYNNYNEEESLDIITSHLKYLIGISVIEPISSLKELFKEMIEQREKYVIQNEIETFIFNSHHYCLMILLFTKHWSGEKEYALESAEKELNEKINAILKQRQANPT